MSHRFTLVIASACLLSRIAAAGTPTEPNGVINSSNVTIGLQQLFTTDSSGAVQMATAPGDATGLYVATVGGKIYRYDTSARTTSLFLDLTAASAAAYSGGPSIGSVISGAHAASGADGMFGLAFAPGFSNPADPGFHKFYTFADEKYATYTSSNTTYTTQERTPDHVNVIREWTATGSGAALSVSASQTSRTVISIGNPGHHNAGDPKFGPDGFLYFTTGDGGGNGDGYSGSITSSTDGFTGSATVASVSNGQDLSSPLGKVIRIDPFVKDSSGNTIASKTNESLSTNGGYFIPTGPTTGSAAGNPFVGATYTIPGKSAPALGEIYAYGLRNPWKFSFDAPTGRMLLSNVGQHQMESILNIKNGTNAGWPFFEGSQIGDQYAARLTQAQGLGSYTPPTALTTGSAGTLLTSYPTRWTSNGALLQDWTGDGSAAVGGFIYHGTAIPQLVGMYIFGDYEFRDGTGSTRTDDYSRFFFVDPNDPASVAKTIYAGNADTGATSSITIGTQAYELNFLAGMGPIDNPSSPALLLGFGQDQSGELYALFSNGNVYAIVAPEPASLGLLAAAASPLLLRRRRRHT